MTEPLILTYCNGQWIDQHNRKVVNPEVIDLGDKPNEGDCIKVPFMKTMRKTSKTKTFQKEDQLHELMDWVVNNVQTDDWQPQGTNWGGGEPGPMDPRIDLDAKYIVTITRIEQP